MKKYLLFGSAVLLMGLFACKNDDSGTFQPPATYPNYSQLKVGNYWIYAQYKLDTNGVETALNKTDSSYVEKDTIINSKTYYKLVRPNYDLPRVPEVYYLRDSLHYLVDASGKILFSSQNFNTSLNPLFVSQDSLYTLDRKMMSKDSTVIVPAGNFVAQSSVEIIDHIGVWSMRPSRYRYTIYSEGVGVIYDTFVPFTNNPDYTIQKLVRYHLN